MTLWLSGANQQFIKDNDLKLGIVINNSNQMKKLCDNVVQIPVSYL
ncbi:MAG: hypothetical protein ISR65_17260 [Bacteriovoracaceae bacterium]|nr:hypothetical protein [Bacteriovoracaceae bacterium]